MKYRLLFIGLLSVLIASLSFNVIHSESLELANQNMEIDQQIYQQTISILHSRIIELEN